MCARWPERLAPTVGSARNSSMPAPALGKLFQKDILNLVYLCRHFGLPEVADYWESVVALNTWQQHRIARLVVEKLFGTVTGKRLAILGFAFKADTNDTREAPAIRICRDLLEEERSWPFLIPRWRPIRWLGIFSRRPHPRRMPSVERGLGRRPVALRMP